GQLVRARRVIGNRRFHRIAGVAQINEIDALDDTAVLDVEAGDDADLECHFAFAARISASASAALSRPSYNARPEIAPSSLDARGSRSAFTSSMEAKPPEAITGIDTASASATVASRLSPF